MLLQTQELAGQDDLRGPQPFETHFDFLLVSASRLHSVRPMPRLLVPNATLSRALFHRKRRVMLKDDASLWVMAFTGGRPRRACPPESWVIYPAKAPTRVDFPQPHGPRDTRIRQAGFRNSYRKRRRSQCCRGQVLWRRARPRRGLLFKEIALRDIHDLPLLLCQGSSAAPATFSRALLAMPSSPMPNCLEIISAVTKQNHDVPIPITSPVTMFGAAPGMITSRSMAEWVLPGFKALQVEEDRLRLAVQQIVYHGQPSFQVFFCRGPNRYPYRRLRFRNRERCTPRNCHPLLTRM